MLKSFVLTFSLVSAGLGFSSIVSPSVAQAHCEECPVPMIHWLGSWLASEEGVRLEISRATGSLDRVIVVVHDARTGAILAKGSGFIPESGVAKLHARLWSTDGRIVNTKLQLDVETHHLKLKFKGPVGETFSGISMPSEVNFDD